MKTLLNYSTIAVMLVALLCTSAIYAQGKKIPITTKSDHARELYMNGQNALEQVEFKTFFKFNQEALAEDPDFFMPLYMESIVYFYFGNSDAFNASATNAIHVNAKLSKGEKLMQNALGELLENPEADITHYGEELVKLYPDDWNSYYTLSIYQMLADENDKAANSLFEATKVAKNPAVLYNQLVYVYLTLGQHDKAKEAADKYLELEPGWANAYDTKGDYFMAVKMYGSAYDQFMKAYQMNADFTASIKKAMKAKSILNKQFDQETISKEIIAVMSAYKEAILKSDTTTLNSYYLNDSDAAFYSNGKFLGYNEFVRVVNNNLKTMMINGEFYKDIKVNVLCKDVAVVYTQMEYSVTDVPDIAFDVTGGAIYILVKRNDDWKIIHGIGSKNN